MSAVQTFPFRFTPAYRRAARLFGVTPDRSWVRVGDGVLDARFGPWRLRTSLGNVTSVAVTGPYSLAKTAGPARLALTDRGLTFATNGLRGVLITFARPVPGLLAFGLLPHSELTVTVADVDELARVLRDSLAKATPA